MDHAQADGPVAVADGVGDEFADDQLSGEGDFVQSPGGELAVGQAARGGDDGGVVRERPLGDAVVVEPAGSREQEDGVVFVPVGQQRVDGGVGQLSQGAVGLGQQASQSLPGRGRSDL